MGRAFEKEFDMSTIGTSQPRMHPERMGAIALGLLWAKWDKEGGMKVGSELQRNLGQIAKDTGFTREELETFSQEILVRFIGKAYGMREVSLTMSDPIPKKSDKK